MNHNSKITHKTKGFYYGSFSDLMKDKQIDHPKGHGLVEIGEYQPKEKIKEIMYHSLLPCDDLSLGEKHKDLEESINKINKIHRLLSHKRERELITPLVGLIDEYFIENIPQMILPSIEKRIKITDDARQVLTENRKLLFSLKYVIDNITSSDIKNYKLKKVDVSCDPEIPEWKPIFIYLKINLSKIKYRLKLKREIVKKAYETLDDVTIKQFYIVGAI